MTGCAVFFFIIQEKKWKSDSCAGGQLLTLQMQGRGVCGRCKTLKNGERLSAFKNFMTNS